MHRGFASNIAICFGVEFKNISLIWYSFVRAEGRGAQSFCSGKQSTWALKVYFDMSEVDV